MKYIMNLQSTFTSCKKKKLGVSRVLHILSCRIPVSMYVSVFVLPRFEVIN